LVLSFLSIFGFISLEEPVVVFVFAGVTTASVTSAGVIWMIGLYALAWLAPADICLILPSSTSLFCLFFSLSYDVFCFFKLSLLFLEGAC